MHIARVLVSHSFDAAVAVARPWIRETVPGDGEAAIRLSGLLEPDRLASMIERHRRRFGENACPRGAASVWSKQLFSALLPFSALAALVGGHAPPDPLLVVADGLPKGVVGRPPAMPWGPPATEASGEWMRQVLGDVAIAALVRSSGLAARLFWSNAAAMLAYLCENWDGLPPVAGRSARLRAALLDQPRLSASAETNPLAGQITYVATPVPEYPTLRRRRLCCLRDRLGQSLCASCPKITAEARDATLRAAAARKSA